MKNLIEREIAIARSPPLIGRVLDLQPCLGSARGVAAALPFGHDALKAREASRPVQRLSVALIVLRKADAFRLGFLEQAQQSSPALLQRQGPNILAVDHEEVERPKDCLGAAVAG